MRDWQGQSHVKWYCKYHVVFVPKYRRRSIYGSLRRQIGGILRELCQQHGVEIVEGHAMPDPIHLCLSIPPKYSVAHTVGFLKGKSAIRIHRQFLGQKRNFTGAVFLGARLLCKHRRLGRGQVPCLPPETGRRGEAARTAAA